MSKPSATYDPEADAIAVRSAPEGARYCESEEIAPGRGARAWCPGVVPGRGARAWCPGVVLDYDAEGRVIGVELRYVCELLASGGAENPLPRAGERGDPAEARKPGEGSAVDLRGAARALTLSLSRGAREGTCGAAPS
jgi:uncharacterized protein YuzE